MKYFKLFMVILSCLLVFTLTGCGFLSTVESNPLRIKPQFDGGNGSVTNPYLISTPKQFYEIRWLNRAHYKLTNDLDFLDFSYQQAKDEDPVLGFKPISLFMGSVDGNGYILKNLNFHEYSYNRMGVFGILKNATIKNLGLILFDYTQQDVIVKNQFTKNVNDNFFGFLVAESINSSISSCYLESVGYTSKTIYLKSTENTVVGGLVGINYGSISDIYNMGSFTVNTSAGKADDYFNIYAGALVGKNYGKISYCLIYSAIIVKTNLSTVSYVGGVAGYNDATIEKIVLHGAAFAEEISFTETSYVGGFAGYTGENSIITNSFIMSMSIGIVNKNQYIGGFVGKQNEQNPGKISFCYIQYLNFNLYVDIKINEKYYGTFVGFANPDGLNNVYYINSNINKVFGNDDISNSSFIIEQSNVNKQESFKDWDFESVWKMSNFPYLVFNDRLWIQHDYYLLLRIFKNN